MGEIGIQIKDKWNYRFTLPFDRDLFTEISCSEGCLCHYCFSTVLDKVYCYIIDRLKKGGLLDKSYKPICCYCKVLKEFGLMNFRRHLQSFIYSEKDDILVLNLSICLESESGEEEWVYREIAIYDYSRWV